jgi:hypothetical protein
MGTIALQSFFVVCFSMGCLVTATLSRALDESSAGHTFQKRIRMPGAVSDRVSWKKCLGSLSTKPGHKITLKRNWLLLKMDRHVVSLCCHSVPYIYRELHGTPWASGYTTRTTPLLGQILVKLIVKWKKYENLYTRPITEISCRL